MKEFFQKNALHFKKRNFVISFVISLVMLIAACLINFYAGTYATEKASSSVTDIILSNIRVFDVDGVFKYATLGFWGFLILLFFYDLKQFPFTVKTLSFFIVIRSLFISLTHLGPFPSQIQFLESDIISKFSFGGDLFFSGHTGIPFLFALIFWEIKWLRYLFIASSLFFGAVVLLGHLHYSIDVLSAFFITYTIYHLSTIIFKNDFASFKEGPSNKI
jgi:hypothetical protein